ncbi:MAG: BrnT family toxin [Deltaproteobacteria bacterium]|nr:BrnT family toxin [Deltaproteobacteria bacterium]
MDFVWDPAKARANLRKHRVSFAEAAMVFGDPFAIYEPEPRHPERGIVIGASAEQRILFVVHIHILEDELIRIISARRATRAEERRYAAGEASD